MGLEATDSQFSWRNGDLYDYDVSMFRVLPRTPHGCGVYNVNKGNGADWWTLDTCSQRRRFVCQKQATYGELCTNFGWDSSFG